MLEFIGIHKNILDDDTSELDIEGARMSGKTWLVSAKIQRSCLRNPGIWWLACRYSGTETDNQLRPQFTQVCRMLGCEPVWNSEESAYWFPEVDGKVSKVFAYGLKTQSKDQRYAKIRGSGVSGVWVDQTEELPEDIGTEIRALLRQPGYQHQLIFSPNPPDEEHFLADQFPDHADPLGRKYYRLSLYDNKHNLPPQTIEKMERAYPPTHAKYKSLILGQRGPNITGTPVYDHIFDRSLHVSGVTYDREASLLEAFEAGKHHPTWVVAQRSWWGGLDLLGGIIGKRLLLEEFLPIADRYRQEWFDRPARLKTCCDPPMNSSGQRYTVANILCEAQLKPMWRENGSAPDVRVSMIEHLGAMMRRRAGQHQAFRINADPSRWLMASHEIIKPTKLMVDGCEGSYVWSENYVSVGNKSVRQPKFDQWLDGWQRCAENLTLNFCAGQSTDEDKQRRQAESYERAQAFGGGPHGEHDWMAW